MNDICFDLKDLLSPNDLNLFRDFNSLQILYLTNFRAIAL